MSRIAMRTGAVEASKARQWPEAQVIVWRVGERHQNRETNEGTILCYSSSSSPSFQQVILNM